MAVTCGDIAVVNKRYWCNAPTASTQRLFAVLRTSPPPATAAAPAGTAIALKALERKGGMADAGDIVQTVSPRSQLIKLGLNAVDVNDHPPVSTALEG